MKKLNQALHSFLAGRNRIKKVDDNVDVRIDSGHEVTNFPDLIAKVAKLSFKNPNFLLAFRGQDEDFSKKLFSNTGTSLYPSILRNTKKGKIPKKADYKKRFRKLETAEHLLSESYTGLGKRFVEINPIIRWSMLQHYEVCKTPLLDITCSIRVASSFAYAKNDGAPAYFYVFGLPSISSGGITVDSAESIQIIRLLTVCPPKALRPHYQEGFLIGEYPAMNLEMIDLDKRWKFDFGRRLICKFRLPEADQFWTGNFQPIPDGALFPDRKDKLKPLMDEIKEQL